MKVARDLGQGNYAPVMAAKRKEKKDREKNEAPVGKIKRCEGQRVSLSPIFLLNESNTCSVRELEACTTNSDQKIAALQNHPPQT